jgi:type II secretory pathway pseudopilin PulG
MDSRPAPAPYRFSLKEWLIVAGILVIIGAIAVPGLLSSSRASSERHASTTLKTFSTAEADFRANDRDWNHVNDFWTADVKGLYTMTSAQKPGAAGDATDPPVRLIELPAAAADADGSFFPAGGENMPLRAFATPAACEGYWYAALTLDRGVEGIESTYRRDTGGTPTMGSCHNERKFGFVAFADSPWKGKFNFIVNENNTIFRFATTGNVRSGTSLPPGLNGFPAKYQSWPSDEDLMQPRRLHGPD